MILYFLTNKFYNFLLIELVGQEDLDARVLQLILWKMTTSESWETLNSTMPRRLMKCPWMVCHKLLLILKLIFYIPVQQNLVFLSLINFLFLQWQTWSNHLYGKHNSERNVKLTLNYTLVFWNIYSYHVKRSVYHNCWSCKIWILASFATFIIHKHWSI